MRTMGTNAVCFSGKVAYITSRISVYLVLRLFSDT